MYKIIGADQKEYGPVTAEQIQLWLAQGRVNALTKIQSNGGEWKALNQFPEFAPALANPIPPRPSAVPNLFSGSAQPVKNSGLALASLVLGILGFFSCGITAIVGLILGIVSLVQINKSNGTVTGRGTALAGTIVSAVFLLMIPFGAALFLPAFARAKVRAESIACLSNARQLALFTQIYASTHTNFPTGATWCDDLNSIPVPTKFFQCPASPNQRCGYAFNTNLSGMNPGKINPNTVLIFESDGGWNASGGPQQALRQSRHGRTIIVAFADGHAEAVTPERLDKLRWNP